MTVHLKPELEAIVQGDVDRGSYQSADEFVERAIQMLHEQEDWLARNRAEIAGQIEHGFAQAERGELIDGDEVFSSLLERRSERRKQGKWPSGSLRMQSRTATTFGSLSHVRPDLTKLPVRFWTLPSRPNYIAVYRPETSPLKVLRVLHGKRNVKRILGH